MQQVDPGGICPWDVHALNPSHVCVCVCVRSYGPSEGEQPVYSVQRVHTPGGCMMRACVCVCLCMCVRVCLCVRSGILGDFMQQRREAGKSDVQVCHCAHTQTHMHTRASSFPTPPHIRTSAPYPEYGLPCVPRCSPSTYPTYSMYVRPLQQWRQPYVRAVLRSRYGCNSMQRHTHTQRKHDSHTQAMSGENKGCALWPTATCKLQCSRQTPLAVLLPLVSSVHAVACMGLTGSQSALDHALCVCVYVRVSHTGESVRLGSASLVGL